MSSRSTLGAQGCQCFRKTSSLQLTFSDQSFNLVLVTEHKFQSEVEGVVHTLSWSARKPKVFIEKPNFTLAEYGRGVDKIKSRERDGEEGGGVRGKRKGEGRRGEEERDREREREGEERENEGESTWCVTEQELNINQRIFLARPKPQSMSERRTACSRFLHVSSWSRAGS